MKKVLNITIGVLIILATIFMIGLGIGFLITHIGYDPKGTFKVALCFTILLTIGISCSVGGLYAITTGYSLISGDLEIFKNH